MYVSKEVLQFLVLNIDKGKHSANVNSCGHQCIQSPKFLARMKRKTVLYRHHFLRCVLRELNSTIVLLFHCPSSEKFIRSNSG